MDDNTPEIDLMDLFVKGSRIRSYVAQEYKNTDEYCDFRKDLRCVFCDDFVDKYLNLKIIKDYEIFREWWDKNVKCRDLLTALKNLDNFCHSDSKLFKDI